MQINEIYQAVDTQQGIQVHFEQDTAWLNQDQIVALFQSESSIIARHIRNIFKEKELLEKSSVQKMAIENSENAIPFYNLDVIIAIGYRLNAKCGTKFRQWVMQRLKNYLVEDYAINQMTIV